MRGWEPFLFEALGRAFFWLRTERETAVPTSLAVVAPVGCHGAGIFSIISATKGGGDRKSTARNSTPWSTPMAFP